MILRLTGVSGNLLAKQVGRPEPTRLSIGWPPNGGATTRRNWHGHGFGTMVTMQPIGMGWRIVSSGFVVPLTGRGLGEVVYLSGNSPRSGLRRLATECGFSIYHPDLWVTMNNFLASYFGQIRPSRILIVSRGRI